MLRSHVTFWLENGLFLLLTCHVNECGGLFEYLFRGMDGRRKGVFLQIIPHCY